MQDDRIISTVSLMIWLIKQSGTSMNFLSFGFTSFIDKTVLLSLKILQIRLHMLISWHDKQSCNK